METDEMKRKWQEMENALAEQKFINEKMVRDMTVFRSKRSVNRLVWWNAVGIVVALAMAVMSFGNIMALKDYRLADSLGVFTVRGIVFTLFAVIFAWNIIMLRKVDLSKTLSENMLYIQKFTNWLKWEKAIVVTLFLLTAFDAITSAMGRGFPFFFWLGLILSQAVIGLFIYIVFRAVFDRNINSIVKSFDELKTLEEK